MFFLSVLDFQRNTLPSFDILAEALVEQVESRARRDDAAWRSESAHDDAAIMAAIHPIPHLDLPTELRHDSIVEYQRLELAVLYANEIAVGDEVWNLQLSVGRIGVVHYPSEHSCMS